MLGSIIPEPLDIPPTVTFLPPTTVATQACFGRVSVVMIAFVASSP